VIPGESFVERCRRVARKVIGRGREDAVPAALPDLNGGPALAQAISLAQALSLDRGPAAAEALFAHIYRHNLWPGRQSRSGPGSDLDQTRTLIAELPALLRSLGVRSVLDIPCGDFHWMSRVDLSGIDYLGADIVGTIIADNRRQYPAPDIAFRRLDVIAHPLPRADLILCRDCLVHFSFSDIDLALANMAASGSTWLLMTTFNERSGNSDCQTGYWRPLNFEEAPFRLPAPLAVIRENCTQGEGRYADKSLGLWRLDAIGATRREAAAAAQQH
jgi:hypothetical protein